MKEFKVSLSNRPGVLTNLAELLGDREINIVCIARVSEGRKSSVVALVTEGETKTRDALRTGRFQFEEKELLTVEPEDKPGKLAAVSGKLGEGEVNIESLYLLDEEKDKVQVALEVDNKEKRRESWPSWEQSWGPRKACLQPKFTAMLPLLVE